MGSRWEFQILGPLEVRRDGVVVSIPAAKLRTLLASLLVDANQVVTVEQLIGRLWHAAPPRAARVTLQNYVMRLRKLLGDSGTLICTRPQGYLLAVDEDAVDLCVFDEWISRGRQLLGRGDARQASILLTQALDLWHGDALSNVTSDLLRQEVVTGLADRRLTGLETRIDADLLLGRHAEILPDLQELTGRHPLRERFWAQLMLALYRSGRQAEALQAYRSVHAVLAKDLGIDPNPDLQRLHQQILAADPALAHSEDKPAHPSLPKQLPLAPRWFTGRRKELDELDAAARETFTVVISAIGGMGGIGKTCLALHWAHRNVDRFPDGQLYVNLRGFDASGDTLPAAAALRGFLDALGVDSAAIPVELDSMVGLYRSMMADRRMLVVLDNASSTDQVVPLLPSSASCVVLVTSRHRLGGLVTTYGAQPLALDPLGGREALDLLISRIGEDKVAAEPNAMQALLEHCAGLPLALSIVAARAATHPDFRLATLAAELVEASARLDALDAGEVTANLRATFLASYESLDATAAEVFCLLGLAPGPDLSTPSVASMVGAPQSRVAAALRELEAAYLVQQSVPGRYRMHDLVRLYAQERALHRLSAEHRTQALARLVEFYTHTAYAGERLLDSLRPPIDMTPPRAGCVPHPLLDAAAALDWFTIEQACLLATLNHCVAAADHRATWRLAWTLGTFHWRQGHVLNNLATWRLALAAVLELGDFPDQIQAYRRLGLACAQSDGFAEALDHLGRSLELAQHNGDVLGEAQTRHSLAWVWARRGDNSRALTYVESALKLVRTVDNPVWEAQALNSVGWYHARTGNHERALGYCRSALELCRRHGDREGEADTLDSLGYIAYHLEQHTDAVDRYQQALTLFDALGHTYELANTLDNLGRAHRALGQHAEAIHAWQQAIVLFKAQQRLSEAHRLEDQLSAVTSHHAAQTIAPPLVVHTVPKGGAVPQPL